MLLTAKFSWENCFKSIIGNRSDLSDRHSWREWERERHKLRKDALERIKVDELTNNLKLVKRSESEALEIEQWYKDLE